ncbi:MAG TPA: hypothetical protein VEG62_01585, partial [Acidimicrobiales bacterium]|nr:hypothetical protein [Acidimicrobiales bacterium]
MTVALEELVEGAVVVVVVLVLVPVFPVELLVVPLSPEEEEVEEELDAPPELVCFEALAPGCSRATRAPNITAAPAAVKVTARVAARSL